MKQRKVQQQQELGESIRSFRRPTDLRREALVSLIRWGVEAIYVDIY